MNNFLLIRVFQVSLVGFQKLFSFLVAVMIFEIRDIELEQDHFLLSYILKITLWVYLVILLISPLMGHSSGNKSRIATMSKVLGKVQQSAEQSSRFHRYWCLYC